MADDVFISYKSERRKAAEHLAAVLRLHGYSVWFDYQLVKGSDFGFQIDRKIREAKAVVVLWCTLSAGSRWVAEEADLAYELGILVPAKIEPCNLPVGFRRQDYTDLSAWDGSPRSHQLDPLIDALAQRIGRPPQIDYAGMRAFEAAWRHYGALPLREFALGKPAVDVEAGRHLPPAGTAGAPPLNELGNGGVGPLPKFANRREQVGVAEKITAAEIDLIESIDEQPATRTKDDIQPKPISLWGDVISPFIVSGIAAIFLAVLVQILVENFIPSILPFVYPALTGFIILMACVGVVVQNAERITSRHPKLISRHPYVLVALAVVFLIVLVIGFGSMFIASVVSTVVTVVASWDFVPQLHGYYTSLEAKKGRGGIWLIRLLPLIVFVPSIWKFFNKHKKDAG
jgi:hypothetical protein